MQNILSVASKQSESENLLEGILIQIMNNYEWTVQISENLSQTFVSCELNKCYIWQIKKKKL